MNLTVVVGWICCGRAGCGARCDAGSGVVLMVLVVLVAMLVDGCGAGLGEGLGLLMPTLGPRPKLGLAPLPWAYPK